MKLYIVTFAMILLLISGCAKNSENTVNGEYFGEQVPGDSALIFAEGIVSNALANRDIAMLPDGKEIYWGVRIVSARINTIVFSKLTDDGWSQPEILPALKGIPHTFIEPHISADGKKMYLFSDMPDTAAGDKEAGDSDIWVMDRIDGGWGNLRNLGAPVNSEHMEFFPSLTKNGALYFSRADPKTGVHVIMRSHFENGNFTEPELLPEEVNSGRNRFNAFVAPDESYIIVPTMGRTDTYGGSDYYISFNLGDGKWSMAENMGPEINSEDRREWSPYVSPDGKYFFFMSSRINEDFADAELNFSNIQRLNNNALNGNADVYWISTNVIEKLKKKVLNKINDGNVE